MNIPVHVVDRKTLQTMYDLDDAFVTRWLEAGEGDIPQMPHIAAGSPRGGQKCGKAKFHLPSFERWFLNHFQRGGDSDQLSRGGSRARQNAGSSDLMQPLQAKERRAGS